ncbi:hypothetical protein AKO1_001792 [Acrasis kona]|uniref:RNA ligase 2 C-terminal domain-containing protein n=1 Tax=Acrasis kona TaxID=1008807 RepID=A0AAW2Z9G6_9EUKA
MQHFLETDPSKRAQSSGLDNNTKQIWDQVQHHITLNRMKNVQSKFGDLTDRKQIPNFIKIFRQDVIEEFVKEQNETWMELQKQKQILILGMISKSAHEMFRENFNKY